MSGRLGGIDERLFEGLCLSWWNETEGRDSFDASLKEFLPVADIVCMIIIPNRTLSRGRISLCPTEILSRNNSGRGERQAHQITRTVLLGTAECVDAYDPLVEIGGVLGGLQQGALDERQPFQCRDPRPPRHGLGLQPAETTGWSRFLAEQDPQRWFAGRGPHNPSSVVAGGRFRGPNQNFRLFMSRRGRCPPRPSRPLHASTHSRH